MKPSLTDYLLDSEGYSPSGESRGRFPLWWLLLFIPLLTLAYYLVNRYIARPKTEDALPTQSAAETDARLQPLKGLTIQQLIRPQDSPPEATPPPLPRPSPLPPSIARTLNLAQQTSINEPHHARQLLLPLLTNPQTPSDAYPAIERAITQVTTQLIYGDQPMPGYKTAYTVAPGDTPDAIARRHGVTTAYVLRAAQVTDPRALRVGKRLNLLDNPRFSWERQTQKNSIVLKLNDTFYRCYTLTPGENNKIWITTPDGKQLINLSDSAQLQDIRTLIRL